MLRFGRKQQNSVKQLSFNKKIKKKNTPLFPKKTKPQTIINHQQLKFDALAFNIGIFYLFVCFLLPFFFLMWQKTKFFVNSSNILQAENNNNCSDCLKVGLC